jgi:hypothetical protein
MEGGLNRAIVRWELDCESLRAASAHCQGMAGGFRECLKKMAAYCVQPNRIRGSKVLDATCDLPSTGSARLLFVSDR